MIGLSQQPETHKKVLLCTEAFILEAFLSVDTTGMLMKEPIMV